LVLVKTVEYLTVNDTLLTLTLYVHVVSSLVAL